jgi:hypothetical protein
VSRVYILKVSIRPGFLPNIKLSPNAVFIRVKRSENDIASAGNILQKD